MPSTSPPDATPPTRAEAAVAVVGLACRLPGAPNAEALWRVLVEGRETVTRLPDGRFGRPVAVDPERGAGRIVTARAGLLDGIDRFDAAFFAITPREARAMDPQQRLLLEVCHEAFEDAGWTHDRLAGTATGVFVGQWTADYADRLRRADPDLDLYGITGGGRHATSGRLSYAFDLRGPSVTVDTHCSSSLVALHQACESVRRGECDAAVAAGVNLILDPDVSVAYSRSSVLSPRGRCRFGDASADGYVRSEGIGVVLLKRLDRALADGDPIRAIVRGTAVNHDGRSSGSLTAPGLDSQRALLGAACRRAGIDPRTVTYVEAHGTGTPVGDPVELTAIADVFGAGRPPEAPCLVGSLKSNIGHCEAAAGIAGFIKAVLCVERGHIPATLHVERPNPAVPWSRAGLRLATESRPWPDGRPVVAAISAFGITGTNATALIAAHPRPPAPAVDARRPRVCPISATTAEGLSAALSAVAEALGDRALRLADVCHTAAVRRTHFGWRAAVVASSIDELAETLAARARSVDGARCPTGERPRVAFVCCGQGGVAPGMGAGLLTDEPVFAEAVTAFDRAFARIADWSIVERLCAAPGAEAAAQVARTEVAQPCLVALQYGLARLLAAWGIEPAAVVGHSVGEVAAALIAGALDLDDAARLVHHRGRAMRDTAALGGEMAAFEADSSTWTALLAAHPELDLAAENGPRAVVLSGPRAALAAVVDARVGQGRFARLLGVGHAFHGRQMAPSATRFGAAIGAIGPRVAERPIYSTVTGRALAGEALDARYWMENIRRPVRFRGAIEGMLADGIDVFVELSPRPTLVRHVTDVAEGAGRRVCAVAVLRPPAADALAARRGIARLFEAGCAIDFAALDGPGAHVSLPGHPWQRQRLWAACLDPSAAGAEVIGDRLPAAPVSPLPPAPLSPGDPIERVRRALAACIAPIIGLPAEAIDGGRRLSRLGFDSLMGLRLRDEVEALSGLRVPLTRLLGDVSLDGLTDEVHAHLARLAAERAGADGTHARRGEPMPSGPPAGAPSHDELVDALDRIDTLSEEELTALLGRLEHRSA